MWVFFQEVMIISRKNGPVCAREEAIFLLSNYCEGPESRAADGRAASRARFCRVVVVRGFCIALIQTENTTHTRTMLHGNDLTHRC